MGTRSRKTAVAAELALLQLEMIGMRALPICPWRLARRSGLTVEFGGERDHVLQGARVVLAQGESDRRVIGGKLARATAMHLLRWHGLSPEFEMVERCARELLVPYTALARFAARWDLDYEAIINALPDVPVEWVLDALDEVRMRGFELAQLRPPITGVVSKLQARGSSFVPPVLTLMVAGRRN